MTIVLSVFVLQTKRRLEILSYPHHRFEFGLCWRSIDYVDPEWLEIRIEDKDVFRSGGLRFVILKI